MLVAAAVCPQPPLLVPGVGAGASTEMDDVRAACSSVVEALRDMDLVVVVGQSLQSGPFPEQAWGTLRPYGVPVDVGSGPGAPTLPLSLTLGRWLLEQSVATDLSRPALFIGVSEVATAAECSTLGERVAGQADRVGMLVMGDGSARRSARGPGYLDDRAEPFDGAVEEAMRGGSPEALAGLDEPLARDLLVTGRAPWQVLAGAAGAAENRNWRGTVAYAAAPYGVTYLVAGWLPG